MDKENAAEIAYEVKTYLEDCSCECAVVPNEKVRDGVQTYYTDVTKIPPDTECVLVLGGDGTMIQAANDIASLGIPLHGINFGGVGFLTETDPAGMWDDIQKLVEDCFRVEKRIMLSGRLIRESSYNAGLAVNDFVVSRREFGKLIDFEVYINDELLDSFSADGIVVSTPTGSTGYNLSAGGPVMAPEMNAIVVTPICPHSINDRSIVIDGNDRIRIRLKEGKNSYVDSAVVIGDGRMLTEITSGDMLQVEKGPFITKIILMEKTNFYHRMRSKLN